MLVRCLDARNPCGIDAAHLSCTDPDRSLRFGIDDGIGFDEFSDLPGKQQIFKFRFSGRTVGDHLKLFFTDSSEVLILNQQASAHPFKVLLGKGIRMNLAEFQRTDARLVCQGGFCCVGECRRQHDLDKLPFEDLADRVGVKRPVEGNNAPKGRRGVRIVRSLVSIQGVVGYCDPAWVSVLDDNACGSAEYTDTLKCGISIGHVIEGKLFPLEHPGAGQGAFGRFDVMIKGSPLVGILAIAHGLMLAKLEIERRRQAIVGVGGQVV